MAHIFFEKLENRRSTQSLLSYTPGYLPIYNEAYPYPAPYPYYLSPSNTTSLWNPPLSWSPTIFNQQWTPTLPTLFNQQWPISPLYQQWSPTLFNQQWTPTLPTLFNQQWTPTPLNQLWPTSPFYQQWAPTQQWYQSPIYSNPNSPTYYYAYGVGLPIEISSSGILF